MSGADNKPPVSDLDPRSKQEPRLKTYTTDGWADAFRGLGLVLGFFALVVGAIALISYFTTGSKLEPNHLHDFAFAAGLVILFLGSVTIIAWLFRLGRFGSDKTLPQNGVWFVIANFYVKLIDDFRHLLAVGVLAIFFVVTVAMLYPGFSAGSTEDMAKGLQAVAATLGSLVASVIGYYFGESAGKKVALEDQSTAVTSTPAQNLISVSTVGQREAGPPVNPEKPEGAPRPGNLVDKAES